MVAYDSRVATYEHIQKVQEFVGRAVANLQERSLVHDRSKLQSPEVEVFDEFTPKLSGVTFGSDEYRAMTSAMKPAIDHHNEANSHHPEHYRWCCPLCQGQFSGDQAPVTVEPDNRFCPRCCPVGTLWEARLDEKPERGIQGMSLLDLVEMVCDWKAATLRHADGDIRRSLDVCQKRFGYSNEMRQILANTIEELGLAQH